MNANTTTLFAAAPAQSHAPEDCWLWCILCERFFLLSSARAAGGGNLDCCPFSDCTGHGLDFELYPWDTARVPEDSRWPASDAELYHGMRAPDYASFARAQFDKRLAPILRDFEASPEYCAEFERPPRYTEAFLSMMAGVYHFDLTDPDDELHYSDIADELICDLPVYAHTADEDEAPRMLAELRALFAFGARQGCLGGAREYAALLQDDRFVEHFKHVMRTDQRLRDLRPRSERPTKKPAQRRKRRKKR
jgi:hypothetical protein